MPGCTGKTCDQPAQTGVASIAPASLGIRLLPRLRRSSRRSPDKKRACRFSWLYHFLQSTELICQERVTHQYMVHQACLVHNGAELLRRDRLLPVAERLVGVRMNL